MPRTRVLLLVGALLNLGAAASTILPWWRSERVPALVSRGPTVAGEPESWSGVEIVGSGATTALWVLAVVAVLLAGRHLTEPALRPAAAGTTAAGAGLALVTGALALAGWGTAQPGPWLALAAGVAALVLTVVAVPRGDGRPRPVLLAVALAGAVAVGLLPGAAGSPRTAPDSGPYLRLATIDGTPPRSGSATLPPGGPATVDGAPVVVAHSGVVGVDAAGRADVLARTSGEVVAVDGDRVVTLDEDDRTLVVSGLRAGDPRSVEITGVAVAGPVGAGGELWLQLADPTESVHRLDLDTLPPTGTVVAATLPLVQEDGPGVYVEWVHPTAGGALRIDPGRDGSSGRVQLLVPTDDEVQVRTLVGSDDAGCGYTRDPARTYLSTDDFGTPVAVDPAGGFWFTDRTRGVDRLLHLGPDGVLRAVYAPLPGPAQGLDLAPDGALFVVTGPADSPGALWRLPDAGAALTELPAPDCGTERRAPAPPAVLVPVDPAVAGAQVLDVDGRVVDQTDPGGAVVAVGPDGTRTPLGHRAGDPARMYSDGRDGVWWLEEAGADQVLVHGTPGAADERIPVPDTAYGIVGPDLGGRPPLLCGAGTTFRLVDGAAVPVVDGCATASVAGPDGRGWLLLDGRLCTLDGDRVGPAVIDAGSLASDRTALSVQLAQGVPATALSLQPGPLEGPELGIDPAGRALLVIDGVVLRADPGGAVEVLATTPPTGDTDAVVGGLLHVENDGRVSRLVLPG